jgi:RNA polymerase sigma-70 factor (ECF subfamily)
MARSGEVADGLLEALRQADPAAHAELWDQFSGRIHAYAARRLRGQPELAEDVLMQTFADAARSIRHFDPQKSPFAAWLFGIARRHIQLELRTRGRRVPTVGLAESSGLSESTDGSDALTDRVHAQRQIALLRTCLSDAEMEGLILHHVHEFSVEEMRRIMGRSARAVNSLLHRARRKARERLARDEREC